MGRSKKIRIPESVILRQILQWLRLQPSKCFVRRINVQGIPIRGNTNFIRPNKEMIGMSDLVGIWKGKPLAIEVKAKGGKPSRYQEGFLASWKAHGGISIIAHSLDDVITQLRIYDGETTNNVIKIDGLLPRP